jgi:ADP-ribosylation factor-like protein 13B
LNFYDVGGHEKFRQIWSNYYADVFGCIYVIDAENIDRIQESKECLFQIAKHDFMVGKPILILINRPGKVSIPWVTEELELNKLTETKFHNSKKHMVCIKEADAKLSADELQAGLEWMVRTIDDNYQNLSLKAHQDVIRQKLKWDAEQREVQLKLQQFNGPKTNKNKVYPIESAI